MAKRKKEERIGSSEYFDPEKNYSNSRKEIGYVSRIEATQADYDRVGFKSGLEVHQQLKTKKKLFCRCPSGLYNPKGQYDAEIIRHMRPTLSELGEYDGTALMEFRTRKEIVYRIKNQTACTYDIDDTPPFPMNREALDIALEIALLSKLNIVGEVEIMRKQYLDGSIPTGFQRTAILGIEGEIPLRHKKIRLIQLSMEEDSCREVSDVGHVRIYQTDRLGMPLIETVTYPDFVNPDEVREGAEYIRFLNRSTGRVNVGIGAGREDVNVSCRGGDRVEIKGVSHNKLIPELTHNEVFRQWALLHISGILRERVKDPGEWSIQSIECPPDKLEFELEEEKTDLFKDRRLAAVNLPGFQGILSHFTQPGKMFADELSDRLKVIACIEKPNMFHTEEFRPGQRMKTWEPIRKCLDTGPLDAQLLVFGLEDDMATALETIEERCRLAFSGIPRESRKSFLDGTTIFERVLPGPDRMYPDTDSAPIPLEDEYIETLRARLPVQVSDRIEQMKNWGIPEDTYSYLLRNNLLPLIEKIVTELNLKPGFIGTLFAHTLKNIEGRIPLSPDFSADKIYDLLKFLQDRGIEPEYARKMMPEIVRYPRMDFPSVLSTLKFKKIPGAEIKGKIAYLIRIAHQSGVSENQEVRTRWIMGQLRLAAFGNLPLSELAAAVREALKATAAGKTAKSKNK